MAIYKLKLIARREVANNTNVFEFEKPEGLMFKPGQYGGFTLMHTVEKDPQGITRRFSLLSAPSEKHLSIATRMQNSAFKRALNNLPLGHEIKFAGPTGNFTLHENVGVPAVLIAGGIGIVPFYCMIKYAVIKHSSQPIHLFYGNQTPSDAPFLIELTQIACQHQPFKLIATMAQSDNGWDGEKGFITEQMIRKNIHDLSAPIYYICGSPTMVTALQKTLAEMGIDEDRIQTEDFPGY